MFIEPTPPRFDHHFSAARLAAMPLKNDDLIGSIRSYKHVTPTGFCDAALPRKIADAHPTSDGVSVAVLAGRTVTEGTRDKKQAEPGCFPRARRGTGWWP
jgi:hypothetical protein